MKKEINFYFRKEKYGWLSNFERCWQNINGIQYPTNEHYYQSMKAKNGDVNRWIVVAPNPYLAMCAGRSLRENKELREDWEDIKVEVMLNGLRAKFTDRRLRRMLLKTGDAILHEDSPTDMFWGKKGEDMLGKLLMRVREEMNEEIKNE